MTDEKKQADAQDTTQRTEDPAQPADTEPEAPEKEGKSSFFGKKTDKKGGAADGGQAGKTKNDKRAKPKTAQEDAEEEALGMRLLRLQADFDNFRKRTLREKKDLYTRANENLIEELLPVLDHMDIALTAAREHEAPPALVDGFSMVQDQLLTALRKFGLSPIDAAEGDFDHNLHEAISHVGSDDVEEGRIVAQVRKGYLLGDRLLRPAQVVVSSGSAEQDAGM